VETATDSINGVRVDTWISATSHSDISAFTSQPYPGNILHNIKVTSNAKYALDFHVYGAIVSGYPSVAFAAPTVDQWDKQLLQVTSHDTGNRSMQVAAVSPPARVQVPKVEFVSPWSPQATTANLNRTLEISVDVR
jgi:hypothetical protein